MNVRWALFAIIALVAATMHADEVYIVQGAAGGPPLSGATTILWTTDALFLNTGATEARVRLLGTSNGG